ncbi:hypothetical protein ACMFMG_010336 [Clarireedia jacksonii]
MDSSESTTGSMGYEKKQLGDYNLAHTSSINQAEVIDLHDSRNGQFHRSFSPRQVHVISLGSNIGSGLFISIGKSLANGGPGNMLVAYALVCSCVWAVLQSLSEMTIAFPTSGNFIDYADRWVDPALAFGAGLAEWLGWTAIVASEASFFNILIQYWAADSFPLAASLTIFLAATLSIFMLPNKVFAWFEYITSLIKILLFLIIITVSLAIVCGAGPHGYVHNGSYWTDLPVFKNGFAGFSNAIVLATWAVGDQVFIGVMGGEAESPRFSMGHATNLVPFRVGFVYTLSIIFVTLLVPSDDSRLLGGSGITASPFVIAVTDAGVPVIPDILNAGMMCGILAISAESIYVSSRILRTMAHSKLIPEVFAKVDNAGRPRWALIITALTAIALTYINLSATGIIALNWFVSISSSCYFFNWFIISFTNWRFHQALEAQNDNLFSQPYAWKSTKWPLAPFWLATVTTLILAGCLAAGINPIGATPSVSNFFQYTLGLLIVIFFTLIYKTVIRTPFRDLKTADLVTGRRILGAEELRQLDEYYSRPQWRRFLTYVQLW